MQKPIGRQSILMVVIMFAIFVLILSPVFGQEKTKVEANNYGVMTEMQQNKIDDVDGHTISVAESKGIGMSKDGAYTFISKGTSDLVKGAGTHHGYQKNIDKDGDIWFGKWEGKVYPMKTPTGKPTLGFEGTWTYTTGTGKWEGVKGGGTYKGMFIGDGIYRNDVLGEYTVKK